MGRYDFSILSLLYVLRELLVPFHITARVLKLWVPCLISGGLCEINGSQHCVCTAWN